MSILARGDRVIATARSLDKLNQLTSSLTHDLGQRLRVSQLDVTEEEEAVHRKIAVVAKFWGCIDVLVNNAGSYVQRFLAYRCFALELNYVSFVGLGLPALVEEGGWVGLYRLWISVA